MTMKRGMLMNKVSFDVECNKCLTVNTINSSNVHTLDILYGVKSKRYTITYLICKKCKTKHYVQADDMLTKHMLLVEAQALNRMINTRNKNKLISDKVRDIEKQHRERLNLTRHNLMLKLNNRYVTDITTNKIFKLKFSSC